MTKNVLVLISILFLGFQVVSCDYTNDWIVHLEDGEDASKVAEQHGFENKGQISSLRNVYHFKHHSVKKRHYLHRREITNELRSHEKVLRAEQDEVLTIHKREEAYNDPAWHEQWYLNSEDSGPYEAYAYNINVEKAWARGYNGSGAVVCVVDDGLEKDHEDLKENYDPLASWDLQDDDEDPSPRYAYGEPNAHGTRCAGEIASAPNNSVCGVGVAYGANIGGIRILDGSVTRIMESKALGHNLDHVDIFSASWGPPDNGKSMDGPKGVTSMVLEEAMANGRDGKGTIYVWASGNGGKNDDCNADGYQTLRYSVSISAVGLNGDTPYYAEPCAAALASTFSSGFVHSIATTDIHGKCTDRHSGTSAAAPIGAGVVALMLQANPNLTWRDVQHILVRAAVPDRLYHHDGWVRNAAGRATNIFFGYGTLDAERVVKIAENWTNVGDDHQCESAKLTYNKVINPKKSIEVLIEFDGCQDTDNFVTSMEHIYLEIDLETGKRGDISIEITSPSNTKVPIMSPRIWDSDTNGFRNWRLMTVFLFGEDPRGTWLIKFTNNGAKVAQLNTMFLDVFGTSEAPSDEQTDIDVTPSRDSNVCDDLCALAEHAYYDSAERCAKCNSVVEVDIERRQAFIKKRAMFEKERHRYVRSV